MTVTLSPTCLKSNVRTTTKSPKEACTVSAVTLICKIILSFLINKWHTWNCHNGSLTMPTLLKIHLDTSSLATLPLVTVMPFSLLRKILLTVTPKKINQRKTMKQTTVKPWVSQVQGLSIVRNSTKSLTKEVLTVVSTNTSTVNVSTSYQTLPLIMSLTKSLQNLLAKKRTLKNVLITTKLSQIKI